MDALDLQKIGNEISVDRMKTPLQNRPKFDIESKDFFNEIGKAIRDGKQDRAAKLLNLWRNRSYILRSEPRCFAAPPCLVRRPNESIIEYLDRCFNEGKKIKNAKLN